MTKFKARIKWAVEKSQGHEEEAGLQGRAVLTSGPYTAWVRPLFLTSDLGLTTALLLS